MGFSYIKSKIIVFKAYRPHCLNLTLVFQQGLAEKAFGGSKQISSGSHVSLNSSVNRIRVFSSAACFYGLKHTHSCLLHGATKRFYHAKNRYPVRIYKSNPLVVVSKSQVVARNFYRLLWKFIRSPRHGFVKFCIVFSIMFASVQKVPYTNRIHLVVSSDKLERWIGRHLWKNLEKKYENRILPRTHPESVRIQMILVEIVQAMQSALMLQKACTVSGYVPTGDEKSRDGSPGTLVVQNRQEKRGRNRRFGFKYGTKHLDGLDWEVRVIDSYTQNAACLPNGRIVFYKGLLRKFKSDEEIATILAHEVGHGLARHHSETLMRLLWIIAVFWYLRHLGQPLGKLIALVQVIISRRREIEADHIGMMLMASAGYDPRKAPKVLKQLGGSYENFFKSTHPSGERRAKLLSKPKVMEKAVAIFEGVKSGHGVNSVI